MSTRDQALAWLRSRAPDQRVGMRCRPGACPLAEFLRDAAGAPNPAVFQASYRLERQDGPTFKLGPWARAAVAAVDASGARHTWLTAAEVLPIWEGIPDE